MTNDKCSIHISNFANNIKHPQGSENLPYSKEKLETRCMTAG